MRCRLGRVRDKEECDGFGVFRVDPSVNAMRIQAARARRHPCELQLHVTLRLEVHHGHIISALVRKGRFFENQESWCPIQPSGSVRAGPWRTGLSVSRDGSREDFRSHVGNPSLLVDPSIFTGLETYLQQMSGHGSTCCASDGPSRTTQLSGPLLRWTTGRRSPASLNLSVAEGTSTSSSGMATASTFHVESMSQRCWQETRGRRARPSTPYLASSLGARITPFIPSSATRFLPSPLPIGACKSPDPWSGQAPCGRVRLRPAQTRNWGSARRWQGRPKDKKVSALYVKH